MIEYISPHLFLSVSLSLCSFYLFPCLVFLNPIQVSVFVGNCCKATPIISKRHKYEWRQKCFRVILSPFCPLQLPSWVYYRSVLGGHMEMYRSSPKPRIWKRWRGCPCFPPPASTCDRSPSNCGPFSLTIGIASGSFLTWHYQQSSSIINKQGWFKK